MWMFFSSLVVHFDLLQFFLAGKETKLSTDFDRSKEMIVNSLSFVHWVNAHSQCMAFQSMAVACKNLL